MSDWSSDGCSSDRRWLQELAPPCLPRCDQANWQPRGWRERCAGRGQAEQTSCSYGRGECRCECAAVLRAHPGCRARPPIHYIDPTTGAPIVDGREEIGTAACREGGCQYV